MPGSCQDLREALAACLQNSPCVLLQQHSAADCLREPLLSELPPDCVALKKGYGQCKRNQIDMRKRFRGIMPPGSVSKGSSGGQLYAGKPVVDRSQKAADPGPLPDGMEDLPTSK